MKITNIIFILSNLLVCSVVHAGILAEKTRLIFEDEQFSKTLMLANTNDYDVILETWVDNGEGSPDALNIPFVTLPVITKIKSKRTQSIRIISNSEKFPKDRESVFWLNLYEIPAIKKSSDIDTYMSLAMNTQLKIFYRPSGLKKIDISSLANLLNFNLKIENGDFKIICSNPTSYHASLTGIQISSQDKVFNIANELDLMSYPKSERDYLILGNLPLNSSYLLDFSLVDDNGVKHNFKKKINLMSN